MTHPMIGGSLLPGIGGYPLPLPNVTYTVVSDQWSAEHYPAPRPLPAMTRDDLAEASALLSTLHKLVGVQADEVMALLTTLLVRRDTAAAIIWRTLRSLDGMART